MRQNIVLAAMLAAVVHVTSASAFTLDAPGGVCPKDPKVQCAIKCDNGNVADYMKWTGSGWSDLVGRIKDADMKGEAGKLVANSNHQNVAMGGKADCK
jgi:hypothetical protein